MGKGGGEEGKKEGHLKKKDSNLVHLGDCQTRQGEGNQFKYSNQWVTKSGKKKGKWIGHRKKKVKSAWTTA